MRKNLAALSLLLASATSISASIPCAGNQPGGQSHTPDYIPASELEFRGALRAPGEGPWDNPEGELKYYIRNSQAIATIFGTIMVCSPVECSVGRAVFSDDGSVYLSSMVNNILGLGYVKGSIDEDDVITFEFPQYMGSLKDGRRLDLYCMDFLGIDENGLCNGAEISSNQTYKMKLYPDGAIVPLPEYEETVIGWSPDGETFPGYGDYGYEFLPQTQTPLTPPDGITIENSTWSNDQIGYFGSMAIDGDNIWVKGMFPTMPESWMKGEKAGNGWYFESGQLLGINTPDYGHQWWDYGYGISMELKPDPWGSDEPMNFITFLDGFSLSPVENGAFISDTGTIDSIWHVEGDGGYSFDTYNGQCTLAPRKELEILATPHKPEITRYQIYEGDGFTRPDYTHVMFNLPPFAEDGVLLYLDNLYFEVEANGEPYVFTNKDYPAIPEEGYSMIPYTFDDGRDMIVTSWKYWSNIHQFTLFQNVSKIGIRSVCMVNGEKRCSDWVYASPEGVDEVAYNGEICEEVYFDLAGVRVANPDKGIYIKVARYSDGTVRTSKACF